MQYFHFFFSEFPWNFYYLHKQKMNIFQELFNHDDSTNKT